MKFNPLKNIKNMKRVFDLIIVDESISMSISEKQSLM